MPDYNVTDGLYKRAAGQVTCFLAFMLNFFLRTLLEKVPSSRTSSPCILYEAKAEDRHGSWERREKSTIAHVRRTSTRSFSFASVVTRMRKSFKRGESTFIYPISRLLRAVPGWIRFPDLPRELVAAIAARGVSPDQAEGGVAQQVQLAARPVYPAPDVERSPPALVPQSRERPQVLPPDAGQRGDHGADLGPGALRERREPVAVARNNMKVQGAVSDFLHRACSRCPCRSWSSCRRRRRCRWSVRSRRDSCARRRGLRAEASSPRRADRKPPSHLICEKIRTSTTTHAASLHRKPVS